MDAKIYKTNGNYNVAKIPKASATVIEAWDFIEMATGLAIKATASGAKLAYSRAGAGVGDTEIEVITNSDVLYSMVADANFAATNRGAEVDLIVTSTVQLCDIGTSSTNVFLLDAGENDASKEWATAVVVKINPVNHIFG